MNKIFQNVCTALSLLLVANSVVSQEKAPAPKPLKALIISGGCCHDYTNQKRIIAHGLSSRAWIEVDAIQQGGSTTNTKIPFYENAKWAEGYDIIIHNECFAAVTDPAWTQRILKPHQEGVPAVVIHCAMHSYRDKTDQWFKFLGVTSHRHGAHYSYQVKNLKPEHAVMKDFGEAWETPKGELYLISKFWDTATPLAHAVSRDTNKAEVCVWTNNYGGTRVFGTTIGHHNETMEAEKYLNMLTNGILWATKKNDDLRYRKPFKTMAELTKEGPSPTPASRVSAFANGRKNVALNKPTTAKSTQENRDSKYAVDGLPNTRFAPNGGQTGEWLQVDLQQSQPVTGCLIHWEMADRIYRYTVEGSVDGQTWEMLSDQRQRSDKEQFHNLEIRADSVRYVRVTPTTLEHGSWGSIWELAVFGAK